MNIATELERVITRVQKQAGEAEERWEASDRTDSAADKEMQRLERVEALLYDAINLLGGVA